MPELPTVTLIRHGETEWTISRRHTGHTDVPLTEAGRQQAKLLGARLTSRSFGRVLTSPLSRAAETCRLAGFGDVAEERDELREWDYGAYEGRTSASIREDNPGWLLWTDGVPDGETPAEVGARVDRVIAEIRAGTDDVAVFAHGHLLRVFASRWLSQVPSFGGHLVLGTAALSELGWEHGVPAITLWNDRSYLT
jgi:broad specificity phosphatase PhoE